MTTQRVSEAQAVDQLIRTVEAQMARWMHKLDCKHNVLDDEVEGTTLWCPGCGATRNVVEVFSYIDREIA